MVYTVDAIQSGQRTSQSRAHNGENHNVAKKKKKKKNENNLIQDKKISYISGFKRPTSMSLEAVYLHSLLYLKMLSLVYDICHWSMKYRHLPGHFHELSVPKCSCK